MNNFLIEPNTIHVVEGEATIRTVRAGMVDYHLTVAAATPATLRIGMLYFPGWTVYRDGQRSAATPQPVTGLLSFSVPAGESSVIVRFEHTKIRTLAGGISVLSLAIVVLLLGFSGYQRLSENFSRFKKH